MGHVISHDFVLSTFKTHYLCGVQWLSPNSKIQDLCLNLHGGCPNFEPADHSNTATLKRERRVYEDHTS